MRRLAPRALFVSVKVGVERCERRLPAFGRRVRRLVFVQSLSDGVEGCLGQSRAVGTILEAVAFLDYRAEPRLQLGDLGLSAAEFALWVDVRPRGLRPGVGFRLRSEAARPLVGGLDFEITTGLAFAGKRGFELSLAARRAWRSRSISASRLARKRA